MGEGYDAETDDPTSHIGRGVRWTTPEAECRLCSKDLALRWTTHEGLDDGVLTRAGAAGAAVQARVGNQGREQARTSTGMGKQGEGTFARNPGMT